MGGRKQIKNHSGSEANQASMDIDVDYNWHGRTVIFTTSQSIVIHLNPQVVDAGKVVKRSKRQSQWTLLDPRTGRPVGWDIIIIMTFIVMMIRPIIIIIKMAA